MLASVTVAYAFFYTARTALDIVKKPLLDAGIFDANELGTIGTCLLLAYAFGKLISGFLADRVHVARLLALGLGGSAILNILMGFNRLYVVACLLWAANGLFQGTGGAASVRSLTYWFSRREHGRAYGAWSTAHSLGEGAMQLWAPVIVTNFGWRAGFISPGLACVVIAVLVLRVLPAHPRAYGLPEANSWNGDRTPDEMISTGQAQRTIIYNPTVWVCVLSSALMYATRYGLKSWGILYLQEVRGYTLSEASALFSISSFAGLFGSFAYGFISDVYFGARRPPVSLIFGVIEIGALGALFHGPRNPWSVGAALFLYGFSLSGILAVLGGLQSVDASSKKAVGMAMGFTGFISYLGAAAQEKISGAILKSHTIVLPDGSKHIADWSTPIAIWIGSSVASLLVASILWWWSPKKPSSSVETTLGGAENPPPWLG